jgi:hypothetical protein
MRWVEHVARMQKFYSENLKGRVHFEEQGVSLGDQWAALY